MELIEIGYSDDPEDAFKRYCVADPARIRDVEMRLAPAIQSEIQVVDEKGQPVGGANVGIYLNENINGGWLYLKTKTNAKGNVEIRIPPASDSKIFAWKSGVGLDYAAWPSVRNPKLIEAPADPEKARLKFNLSKAATVSVQVVDSVSNQPNPDVSISIQIPGRPGIPRSSAGIYCGFGISTRTDNRGHANIDWLPDWAAKQTLDFWGLHPKYNNMDGVAKVTIGQKKQSAILKLNPLIQLRGLVLQQDGSPAAGITVESSNVEEWFRDRTVTDEKGRYELTARPNLKTVVLVLDDKWGAEPQTAFTIEQPGLTAKVPDIRLSPVKRVHGVLRAEEGKTPVPGEQIWLHIFGPPRGEKEWPSTIIDSHGPHATLTTWTDKNGRFEFPVGPCAFLIQGPKDFESADGVFVTRSHLYWSRNLAKSKRSMEYNILRPVWTETP
jgi:hypothetical protein